jgi:hypothetical protein
MGQVNQPSDVNSEIRELKRQVAELTKRVGLSSAVISRGGLRIINEGEFTVLNASDIEAFKVGQVEFGEGSSFGMQVNYEDGTRGIVFGGTPGQQVFALCDETGNYLVTNDSASGHGLARPYLNIPMVPSHGTSIGTGGPFWPEFTNTSFQEVMYRITTLWHPKISFGVNTNTSSGTVDWELRVDGVTAGSGSGDGAGVFNVPGWGSTILPGDQRSVQLWCRNTTGTASRAVVDRCYGTQS